MTGPEHPAWCRVDEGCNFAVGGTHIGPLLTQDLAEVADLEVSISQSAEDREPMVLIEIWAKASTRPTAPIGRLRIADATAWDLETALGSLRREFEGDGGELVATVRDLTVPGAPAAESGA